MKKQQLRLLEILKTCPDLKKEIETLTNIWWNFKIWQEFWKYLAWESEEEFYWNTWTWIKLYKYEDVESIWQANYQHLLRFLRHKWIDADIDTYLDLNLKSEGVTVWTLMSFEIGNLLDQEETTLEMLCDYLETIN